MALEKMLKNLLSQKTKNEKAIKKIFDIRNKRKDVLIVKYMPLIRFIANKMILRLPSNVEIDDLISCGMVGLMDAIDKYNPQRENKFQTYAEFRIRGAMLDELRSQDWVPRSIRDKAKVLEKAISNLEAKWGRKPKEEELASHLNLSLDEFYEFLNKVRPVSLFSINEGVNLSPFDRKAILNLLEDSKLGTPFGKLNGKDVRKFLIKAIEALPEKQRVVLSLYYYEDLNLKEIGRVLRVTESRISQLHTQALVNLKSQLRRYFCESKNFEAS